LKTKIRPALSYDWNVEPGGVVDASGTGEDEAITSSSIKNN